jgi:hypothetical protein
VQRPFVEGLAQELRAGPTMVNPMLLSTGFEDGSDTAVALNLLSCPISVATSSERSDQSWRHRSRALLPTWLESALIP